MHVKWLEFRFNTKDSLEDLSDRRRQELHGTLFGPKLPSARCEKCNLTIWNNRTLHTSVTLEAASSELFQVHSPRALGDFLAQAKALRVELGLRVCPFPCDAFLPIEWTRGIRPDRHFFFPNGGILVSEDVVAAWHAAKLRGAKFLAVESRRKDWRKYFKFNCTYRNRPSFDGAMCDYCRALLNGMLPEVSSEYPADDLDAMLIDGRLRLSEAAATLFKSFDALLHIEREPLLAANVPNVFFEFVEIDAD